MFYTESVTHGPRFIPQSVFITQSGMLSPPFIPESMFYTQSVVRSPQSLFYTDRCAKVLRRKCSMNTSIVNVNGYNSLNVNEDIS